MKRYCLLHNHLVQNLVEHNNLGMEEKPSLIQLISNRKFIFISGVLIRLIITLNFTGWLHDDEVFQSMDIAYSMIFGSKIKFVLIPYEFRDQVRSYAWPVLLVPWIFLLIQIGLNGQQIYLVTRFFMSIFGMLPILLFNSESFSFEAIRNDYPTQKKWLVILIQWVFAFYLPWLFLTFHINADGISAPLTALIVLANFPVLRNQDNQTRLQRMFNKPFVVFFSIGMILAIRPQYLIILLAVLFKYIIDTVRVNKLSNIGLNLISLFLGTAPRIFGDWYFYGQPLVPLINFIKFNVTDQKNVIYNSAPDWFYFVEFILLLYIASLPLVITYIIQVFKGIKHEWKNLVFWQLICNLLYLSVFQILQHKEPRFIILPTMLIFFQAILFNKFSISSIPTNNNPNYLVLRLDKNKIKITILVILLLPLVLFPSHIQDAMWNAEAYANSVDPNGKKLILATQFSGGGNLIFLQPHHPVELIYVGMDSTSNASMADLSNIGLMIFENSTHVTINQTQALLGVCNNPYFLKTFTDTRTPFYYALQFAAPEKLRDYSVWNCNYY